MRILSLDIGTRRTGIAYADTEIGIPLPLDTIHHTSVDDLLSHVQKIMLERSIDHVVIGLPLLLSGEEGAQSVFVRSVGEILAKSMVKLTYLDERYSTPPTRKEMKESRTDTDPDAAAACAILGQFLMFDNNKNT